VAAELIRLVREKYHSYDDQRPLAAILKELGSNVAFIGFKDAVQAVKDHHTSSQHPFTFLLKEADSRAREKEHMQIAKKHTIKPFNEWFEPWCFMARLDTSSLSSLA